MAELFSLTCATCNARLKVRDPSAVGQILYCPKCHSMVHVVPPPGWTPPAAAEGRAGGLAQQPVGQPAKEEQGQSSRTRPADKSGGAISAAGSLPSSGEAVASRPEEKPLESYGPLAGGVDQPAMAERPTAPVSTHGHLHASTPPQPTPEELPAPLPPPAWASPVEQRWRRWTAAAVATAALVLVVAMSWSWLASGKPSNRPPGSVAASTASDIDSPTATHADGHSGPAPAPVQPSAEPADSPAPVADDRGPLPRGWRWLPAETRLLVSLRPGEVAVDQPIVAGIAPPWPWQPVVESLQQAFGLAPAAIDRITWATTDLSQPSGQEVWVIELELPLEDDSALLSRCEKLPVRLDEAICHRPPSGSWPHPFAVVDPHTIVTGPLAMLSQLAHVSDRAGPPLAEALRAAETGALVALAVDAEALRAAGWKLPLEALLGSGVDTYWEGIVALPRTLTLSVSIRPGTNGGDDTAASRPAGLVVEPAGALGRLLHVELRLVCADKAQAEIVRKKMADFSSLLVKEVANQRNSLSEQTASESLSSTTVAQRERWLSAAEAGLAACESGVAEQVAWLRSSWPGGPRPTIEGLAELFGWKTWVPGDNKPAEALARQSLLPDDDPPRPAEQAEAPAAPAAAEAVAGEAGEPQQPAPAEKPVAAVLPAVDVDARLADKIHHIDFPKIKLAELAHFLSRLSTLPITLDLESLAEAGASPDTEVALRATDATLGEALEMALAEHGLGYVVEAGQVIITTSRRQRQSLREVRYSVGDLARGGEEMEDLARLVRQFVEPDSWEGGEGAGTIAVDGQQLVVRQHASAHYQTVVFCERLRLARGLPPASRLDPSRFPLATRYSQAADKLARPLTVNFAQPTALERIAAHLRQRTGMNVLFDGVALRAEGLSSRMETTWKATDQPLGDALERLLKPLGLALRLVDANTLQITTRSAALTRLDVEFYPLADLAAERQAAELIAELKDEVAPKLWDDQAGAARIDFDTRSGYLIVLAPQSTQIELEEALARRRAPPPDPVGEAGAADALQNAK